VCARGAVGVVCCVQAARPRLGRQQGLLLVPIPLAYTPPPPTTPTPLNHTITPHNHTTTQLIDQQQQAVRMVAASLNRLPTEDYEAYEAAGQRFLQDKGQVRLLVMWPV